MPYLCLLNAPKSSTFPSPSYVSMTKTRFPPAPYPAYPFLVIQTCLSTLTAPAARHPKSRNLRFQIQLPPLRHSSASIVPHHALRASAPSDLTPQRPQTPIYLPKNPPVISHCSLLPAYTTCLPEPPGSKPATRFTASSTRL